MDKKTIRYNDAEWYGGINLVVNYTLEEGVLTVLFDGSFIHRNPANDAEEIAWDFKCIPYAWSRYESPFVDLDFHTAVLEPGFTSIEEDFFTGCINLKRVIIPDTITEIHLGYAKGIKLEYLKENGLLFMGNDDNPRHFLMGCVADFNEEHLNIPEGVNYIHAIMPSDSAWLNVTPPDAFAGRSTIKAVTFPKTLKKIGKYAFMGISLKNLFIPDFGIGEDEIADYWYWGFCKGCSLESISVPYNHYLFYLDNKDEEHVDWWHAFPNCTITFRKPDGATALILPPDPNPKFNEPQPLELPEDESFEDIKSKVEDSISDGELPF